MKESLIHRWSKQKSQKTRDDDENRPEKTHPESSEALSDVDADTPAGQVGEEEKEPVELPPIDSLDADSDYSMFMSPEVDEGIKKLALRKLFKSPIFNVVDGLNDYDDDFTTFEALGDIVTSDMKFHEERKRAERELEEQQSADPEDAIQPDDAETLAADTAAEEDEPRTAESGMKKQAAQETAPTDEQSDTDADETPAA